MPTTWSHSQIVQGQISVICCFYRRIGTVSEILSWQVLCFHIHMYKKWDNSHDPKDTSHELSSKMSQVTADIGFASASPNLKNSSLVHLGVSEVIQVIKPF